MMRAAVCLLMLAGLAGCSDPVGGIADVERDDGPIDIWVTPCCFLTYAHAQTAVQQTLPAGGTMELNVAYLNKAGAVLDLTAASAFTFEPEGRMSIASSTIPCTAMPTKRCRVVTNHSSTPGEVTVATADYKGNTATIQFTTSGGS